MKPAAVTKRNDPNPDYEQNIKNRQKLNGG